MITYNPIHFAQLYATPLGERLWQFLNQPENVVRLKTAADLGHAAVEGIAEELLGQFDPELLADRVKQMIGHMVRQVLEYEGYVISTQNAKITGGAPFSRGTKYKKRDEVTFYAFRSSVDARRIGLTFKSAGETLPKVDNEKWIPCGSFTSRLRGIVAYGVDDSAAAESAIAEVGYFIYEQKRLMKATGG